jgi:hypothetical protein
VESDHHDDEVILNVDFIKVDSSDPESSSVHCALCGRPVNESLGDYPNPVCRTCDSRSRAVNTAGQRPAFISALDDGDNPVFIDERKCWRRYRFGGYITMLDDGDARDILEFYARHHKSGGNCGIMKYYDWGGQSAYLSGMQLVWAWSGHWRHSHVGRTHEHN